MMAQSRVDWSPVYEWWASLVTMTDDPVANHGWKKHVHCLNMKIIYIKSKMFIVNQFFLTCGWVV